ncbi:MAG: hypothetical protein EZS28_048111 [Streblomastix strix]|uniref:Uncharacterized protein n=1 Tax=Streblomastix strix TaxID=222440 RepID=A0A5J4TEK8_9EUKA|nr:MAG: hypothetical protein EZS28_048111 [Streblomastix strix]
MSISITAKYLHYAITRIDGRKLKSIQQSFDISFLERCRYDKLNYSYMNASSISKSESPALDGQFYPISNVRHISPQKSQSTSKPTKIIRIYIELGKKQQKQPILTSTLTNACFCIAKATQSAAKKRIQKGFISNASHCKKFVDEAVYKTSKKQSQKKLSKINLENSVAKLNQSLANSEI